MIRLTATSGGVRFTKDGTQDAIFISREDCEDVLVKLPEKLAQSKEMEIEKVKEEIRIKQEQLASLTN